MSKKHAFLQFFSKIAIFACVFCTIPAWSETTCDIDYTPVTGNSIQNGTPTPTAPVEIESVGTKVGNKYQISVVAQGKNLFDSDNTGLQYKNRSLATTQNGYWYWSNGSACFAVQVKPNTTYTISGFNPNTTIARVAVFSTTLPSQTSQDPIAYDSVIRRTNDLPITITTGNNSTFIAIQVNAITFDATKNTMQVEEGSVATSYAPYSAPITTTVYMDEPLRKVGDYADILDYKNGTITRNVGVKVFDGTENWTIKTDSTGEMYFEFISGDKKHGIAGLPMSTHYATAPSTGSTNIRDKQIGGSGNNGYTNIWIKDFSFSSVSEWKSYLAAQYSAGTPVTVYYVLATPVVEQIENWSCTPPITDIKIATTKYVDDEFAPLNTALANAISVVDNVVTQTIAQATAIGELQNTKQTRPSDDNECPANMKCLLVTDESGTPHWYPIIEP